MHLFIKFINSFLKNNFKNCTTKCNNFYVVKYINFEKIMWFKTTVKDFFNYYYFYYLIKCCLGVLLSCFYFSLVFVGAHFDVF